MDRNAAVRQPWVPPVPEPVTAGPPRGIDRPVLTQSWLDLTFVHWAVEPAAVSPLLPPGCVPDTHGGVTYAGLIAFRMHRIGWFGLPGLPYFGTFPETNVRLYSVDAAGRRGVVFRSLETSRLAAALVARAGFGLPYMWARMAVRRDGRRISYASARRWPGPRGARSRLTVTVGARIAEPTPLEHFLTARWALHSRAFGRTLHLPNSHPRWALYRAGLEECRDDLVGAAGLPRPEGEPVSVLYSPGVPVRFALPSPGTAEESGAAEDPGARRSRERGRS
ncbi:YqjF family protein [Streptomyces sp. SM14]|uniref:YqjF family protein n=1 Tax=Streptomyces sp. SM14 TaxID=1736045 RepID=UPI000CD5541F|nr:DUF2071 domain-containing protein [Streptomyces sp. SM14]